MKECILGGIGMMLLATMVIISGILLIKAIESYAAHKNRRKHYE